VDRALFCEKCEVIIVIDKTEWEDHAERNRLEDEPVITWIDGCLQSSPWLVYDENSNNNNTKFIRIPNNDGNNNSSWCIFNQTRYMRYLKVNSQHLHDMPKYIKDNNNSMPMGHEANRSHSKTEPPKRNLGWVPFLLITIFKTPPCCAVSVV
jgi:hypothetical protein